MKYEKVKDQMKTGDIIFFEQENIGTFQNSFFWKQKLLHIGMILRLIDYEEPLLFEASPEIKIYDVIEDVQKSGPKIVNLRERLQNFEKEFIPYVPITFFYHPIHFHREIGGEKKILALHKKMQNEKKACEYASRYNIITGRYFAEEKQGNCITSSELVALAYMELGLLTKERPATAFTIKDFAKENHFLQLNQGEFGTTQKIEI